MAAEHEEVGTHWFSKPVHYTILYYAIAIIAIMLFNTLPGFESGVCGPNFDVVSIFFSFLGAIVLLGINLVRLKTRGQGYFSSVVIHAAIILAFIIALFVNS